LKPGRICSKFCHGAGRTCEKFCHGGSPESGAEIKMLCRAGIAKLGGKAKESDEADWADEAEVGNEANGADEAELAAKVGDEAE
jgi:hypothetical protein